MRRYEEPYHPTSSRESKAEVIFRIVVVMIVLSILH